MSKHQGEVVDLLGYALIEPRLNAAECEYLTAFAESSRTVRQDPYAVPMNPAAGRNSARAGSARGGTDGVPDGSDHARSSWCPWAPAVSGRVLAPRGSGVARGSAVSWWLRYLIRNFLAVGGLAGTGSDPRFADFTFDHEVNGVFVARWRRTGRMTVFRVRSNRVRRYQLVPSDPDLELWGALPYEDELDRFRLTREHRRRVGPSGDLHYPVVGAER